MASYQIRKPRNQTQLPVTSIYLHHVRFIVRVDSWIWGLSAGWYSRASFKDTVVILVQVKEGSPPVVHMARSYGRYNTWHVLVGQQSKAKLFVVGVTIALATTNAHPVRGSGGNTYILKKMFACYRHRTYLNHFLKILQKKGNHAQQKGLRNRAGWWAPPD